MARLTGFEPVTIRLEGGCSIQLSYKRLTDVNIICLEELVGAVGFEPTTPWSQTRCTTRLCYAPIHLSFHTDQLIFRCIVRYGVHSRLDARRRQHLSSKKYQKMLQAFIYQALLIFFKHF
jgi:hypothetical protein